MRPFIGITPQYDKENNKLISEGGYFECIEEAGGIPVVLPVTEDDEIINEMAEKFDGFVFSCGPDIDPVMYDMKLPIMYRESGCLRDRFEKKLFNQVAKTSKPVLGICRGMQMINVVCGGTLFQDIGSEVETDIDHMMEEPRNRTQHNVSIYIETPLYKMMKEKVISVNSVHHQAIKELSESFVPMAFSFDGLIEAYFMPGMRYMHGYQWSPELFPEDEVSKKIFKGFIRACTENNGWHRKKETR